MFPGLRVRRCHPLALLILISVTMSASSARKRASETPALAPIRAELVGAFDARFLKQGSPILLKVKNAWQNGDCKLREGSILKGHVVDANVSSNEDRISKVAMVMDEAECNGPALVPLPLVVAAIVAPDPAEFGNVQTYAPLNALPVAIAGASGTGPQALSASATVAENSATALDSSPKQISMGDVLGLSRLKLSVGTGPEQSSVLFMKGHNVSLPRHTQFVLVPAALITREIATPAAPPASTMTAAGSAAPPVTPRASSVKVVKTDAPLRLPEPEPEPDVEVCAPPSCSIALSDATTISQAHAQQSFPLRELGYAPRPGVELDDFDHEAALAYLGQHELLVTFNPHTLIDRKDGSGDVARMVRAAVLDTSTMRAIRIVDWPIADRNQYLWPAGEDRVLAHVGNELRVYGPGLTIERRIELRGPLAWVRVSPSQKNFVIGVILERHSKELHAQLAAANPEPEEDLETRVLNSEFETTAMAIHSSRFMPPVLTNEGEVGVHLQGHDKWHLVEHTWDHQAHSIAYVTSACMPQVSSVAPDLLFIVTCGRSAGAKYRVLRRDGSLLLQGNSSSEELGQGVHGTLPGTAFVVGIDESYRAMVPGGYFYPSDLKEEHFAVYRATDGKRIFTTHVDSPAPTREAYALAPGASELAVLSGEQLSLYAIPR
ncbi:MAG TPA: hypothetical protein VMB19_16140 [Silvibacterium sp.]|nr:hypothetical protein [Silvibacterium sp.]